MNVKTIAEYQAEGKSPEIVFWVGCAGSFDARAQKITRALCEILEHAGVEFAILGNEERCTGDPARRAGNEFLFQMTAAMNIETLNLYGVKKIVTACPHCFNTLKNEYPALGGHYELVHHTQLINSLIEEGKLKMKESGTFKGQRITYHDSCYLGRYNGVFEQPRKLIEAVTGKAPLEMERRQGTSFCCGAGGGRMWMEETEGTRINMARVTEAMKSDPDAICVCCPYCVTMMEDGLTDIKAPEKVKVIEISELVEKALK